MPVPWKCDSLSKVNPFLFFLKCLMTRSPCSWWWLNRETNNNFVLILSAKTNNYNLSLKKRALKHTYKNKSPKDFVFAFFHILQASIVCMQTGGIVTRDLDFLKKLHVLSISRIKTVCNVPCGTKFLLVVIFAILQRSANIFPANIYSKVNVL